MRWEPLIERVYEVVVSAVRGAPRASVEGEVGDMVRLLRTKTHNWSPTKRDLRAAELLEAQADRIADLELIFAEQRGMFAEDVREVVAKLPKIGTAA